MRARKAIVLQIKEHELALEQRRNEEQLRMMREMKQVGVDLTKVRLHRRAPQHLDANLRYRGRESSALCKIICSLSR